MRKLILFLFLSLFLRIPDLLADCEITQGSTGFIDFGPLTDDTDFKTAKTVLTIQKADVRLSKNAAAYAAANSNQSVDGVADTGAPHNENGKYRVRYNTTDSDTIGNLSFVVKKSGALVAWRDCIVRGPTAAEHALNSVASLLDASNYDCANNTNPNSAVGRICSNKFDRADARGTVLSGSTTTIVDPQRTEPDGIWVDRAYVVFTSGVLQGTSASITGYSLSTNTLTLAPALISSVTAGDNYEIRSLPGFLRPTVAGRTVNVSSAGAADSNLTHVAGTAQTPGDIINDTNTIKNKTNFLPSATAGTAGGLFIAGTNADTTANFTGNLSGSVGSVSGSVGGNLGGNVSGNVNGSVASVAAGGINAASFAANAINAAKVDPDVSVEFVTTLFGTAYEGAETFKDLLRYQASMLFRNYTSSGANYSFKDVTGTKNRVTYSSTPTSRTVTAKDATD